MNDETTRDALRTLRDEAERLAATIPVVPTREIIARAQVPAGPRFALWSRIAVAAAAVFVAAISLMLINPAPSSPVETPAYLSSLVDSLYPDGDYMLDQVAPLLGSAAPNDYLSDVWGDVVSEIQAQRD